jgi:predicted RNase H-related nuclease YkuK (DUF458 family)
MYCPDQRHNTSECKVINGEIERLQGFRIPSFNKNKDSQQGIKPSWVETKKRMATSYRTKQLTEFIRMTRKKAMEDAKVRYEIQAEAQAQTQTKLKLEKMHTMELFINDLMDSDESDIASDIEEEEEELTQAVLDELTGSLST